jgi:hypothetical protein
MVIDGTPRCSVAKIFPFFFACSISIVWASSHVLYALRGVPVAVNGMLLMHVDAALLDPSLFFLTNCPCSNSSRSGTPL